MPIRIQLSRKKGWRMPANTVKVTRPGKFGNPFRVGGWFRVGDPDPTYRGAFRMSWCEANPTVPGATKGFTFVKDSEMAVDFFKRLCANGYFTEKDLAELRGKNLACWCKEGACCHGDVLLELANK